MLNSIKKPIGLFLIIALILMPFGSAAIAQGNMPSAGAMIADTALARPLGIATTIAGSVLFVISVPFSALGGNVKASYIKLIKEPFVFSFKRPLGDF